MEARPRDLSFASALREETDEDVHRCRSGVPLVLLTSDERDDSGQRPYAVARSDRSGRIGVDPEDADLARMALGDLLDDRLDGAAWATPLGAEVEKDGQGRLQHLLFEVLFRDHGNLSCHAGTGAKNRISYARIENDRSCKKPRPRHLTIRDEEPVDPIAAVTDLIREHRGALVRAARREGLSAEDAVECAQEALSTFLQVLQRGDAPADRAGWAPYVTTIAKNAARNRRRRHHVALRHETIEGTETASDAASAEDLLAQAEEHVRLRACVERLCGTQRSVVMLRLLEERAGEDVAAVLGITRGHVDVLLHRAKASLRECMTE